MWGDTDWFARVYVPDFHLKTGDTVIYDTVIYGENAYLSQFMYVVICWPE